MGYIVPINKQQPSQSHSTQQQQQQPATVASRSDRYIPSGINNFNDILMDDLNQQIEPATLPVLNTGPLRRCFGQYSRDLDTCIPATCYPFRDGKGHLGLVYEGGAYYKVYENEWMQLSVRLAISTSRNNAKEKSDQMMNLLPEIYQYSLDCCEASPMVQGLIKDILNQLK